MKILDLLFWFFPEIGGEAKAPPSKPSTKPVHPPEEPVQQIEPDLLDEDSDLFFDEFME